MVVSGEGFREGLQPSLSPILQIYAALKSSFVAVFAALEAITDGLNPLTISHAARVSSCKKIGRLNNRIGDPEKGSIWRNICKKTEVKCNRIATMPQPDSHLGMSFD
jgi:hypothetical protein